MGQSSTSISIQNFKTSNIPITFFIVYLIFYLLIYDIKLNHFLQKKKKKLNHFHSKFNKFTLTLNIKKESEDVVCDEQSLIVSSMD